MKIFPVKSVDFNKYPSLKTELYDIVNRREHYDHFVVVPVGGFPFIATKEEALRWVPTEVAHPLKAALKILYADNTLVMFSSTTSEPVYCKSGILFVGGAAWSPSAVTLLDEAERWYVDTRENFDNRKVTGFDPI